MLKLLLLLGVSAGIKGNVYNHHTYQLIYERAVLTYYNPDYFKYIHVLNTKFNRTTKTLSLTYEEIKDIPYLTGRVQAYVFLSNEYKVFPIRINIDFCEAFEKNYYGFGVFVKLGNVTKCPFKTGVFYVKDYLPDGSKFPPNIPVGSYRLDISMVSSSTKVFAFEAYATIKKNISNRKVTHK